jgi:hypothetical protein
MDVEAQKPPKRRHHSWSTIDGKALGLGTIRTFVLDGSDVEHGAHTFHGRQFTWLGGDLPQLIVDWRLVFDHDELALPLLLASRDGGVQGLHDLHAS